MTANAQGLHNWYQQGVSSLFLGTRLSAGGEYRNAAIGEEKWHYVPTLLKWIKTDGDYWKYSNSMSLSGTRLSWRRGGLGIHKESAEGTAWNHDKLVYIGNPVSRHGGEIRPWGDPPICIHKQRLS